VAYLDAVIAASQTICAGAQNPIGWVLSNAAQKTPRHQHFSQKEAKAISAEEAAGAFPQPDHITKGEIKERSGIREFRS
jgi:hypothetical protein